MKLVKLVVFCGMLLFVVTACSMWPEQSPPAGPTIVNNMPAPPAADGNMPWLIILALLAVVAAVWKFRDCREATARATAAERALELNRIATSGVVLMNGVYYQPSALPTPGLVRHDVPMLEARTVNHQGGPRG